MKLANINNKCLFYQTYNKVPCFMPNGLFATYFFAYLSKFYKYFFNVKSIQYENMC